MTTLDIHTEVLRKIPKDFRMWIDQSFELSNRIADLMEQRGLSKSDMAQIFEVSEETISWWIGGTYNFDLETLAKISAYFGKPLISVM